MLRFMDIFLVEGCKATFRLALSLLQLISKRELKVRVPLQKASFLSSVFRRDLSIVLINYQLQSLVLTDSNSWWNAIRLRTLDPAFSFQKHLDIMYPKFGKIVKRYPKRRVIRRTQKYHEKWAMENMPVYVDQTPPKPMG